MRFFMDSKLNTNGGTLIFSTTILNCWMNTTEMTVFYNQKQKWDYS